MLSPHSIVLITFNSIIIMQTSSLIPSFKMLSLYNKLYNPEEAYKMFFYSVVVNARSLWKINVIVENKI